MSDETEREAGPDYATWTRHELWDEVERLAQHKAEWREAAYTNKRQWMDACARADAAEARVRELEAALQQSRDDHQGAVEKLRAVEALADEGWHPQSVNTREDVVLTSALRAALASPVESDTEDEGAL
jgi:hypothetical protein